MRKLRAIRSSGMSIGSLSLILALGLALILLGYAPPRFRSPFADSERRKSFIERFRLQLQMAGMFDQAPTFVLLAGIGLSLVVGLLFAIIAGSVLVIPAGPILVFGWGHYMLLSRQRNFLVRAGQELIPFLRKIQAAVGAGRPADRAYRQAVMEARFLKPVLLPSAEELVAGATFVEALDGTIERLPLRMWFVFVRQMEIHEESGGHLTESLAKTVEQIAMMLQLQAQARADYAAQSMQQKLIVLVVFAALGLMFMIGGPAMRNALFGTTVGIVMLILGGGMIFGGLWLGRRQLRDIDKRLNF